MDKPQGEKEWSVNDIIQAANLDSREHLFGLVVLDCNDTIELVKVYYSFI